MGDIYNQNLYKHDSQHKTNKKGHYFFKFLFVLILIIIVIGCVFFLPYIITVLKSYDEGFDTARIDVENVPHIYDKNGNLISIMYGYYDSKKENFVPTYSCVYTDLNSLPKYIRRCFYCHRR